MKPVAVLHASQLVTLAGPNRPRVGHEMSDLAIIRDGGILIRDGKIDIVGSSAEIKKKAADCEIVNAVGRVVLPGLPLASVTRSLPLPVLTKTRRQDESRIYI